MHRTVSPTPTTDPRRTRPSGVNRAKRARCTFPTWTKSPPIRMAPPGRFRRRWPWCRTRPRMHAGPLAPNRASPLRQGFTTRGPARQAKGRHWRLMIRSEGRPPKPVDGRSGPRNRQTSFGPNRLRHGAGAQGKTDRLSPSATKNPVQPMARRRKSHSPPTTPLRQSNAAG